MRYHIFNYFLHINISIQSFYIDLLKKKKKRGILIAPDTYWPLRLRSKLTSNRTPWVASHGIFCKSAKKFRTFFLMYDIRSILTLTSGVNKYSQKKNINIKNYLFIVNLLKKVKSLGKQLPNFIIFWIVNWLFPL